jgi:hypothetical protein
VLGEVEAQLAVLVVSEFWSVVQVGRLF